MCCSFGNGRSVVIFGCQLDATSTSVVCARGQKLFSVSRQNRVSSSAAFISGMNWQNSLNLLDPELHRQSTDYRDENLELIKFLSKFIPVGLLRTHSLSDHLRHGRYMTYECSSEAEMHDFCHS